MLHGASLAPKFPSTVGRAGADVLVSYHDSESEAAKTVAAVEAAGQRAVLNRCDVTIEAEVAAMVQAAVTELGGVDIMVGGIRCDCAHSNFKAAPLGSIM